MTDPELIKSFRAIMGLSQAKTANALGLKSNMTVWKWEKGQNPIPKQSKILIKMILEARK